MDSKKEFKSTKSLYGVDPEYFCGMSYIDVIKEKIKLSTNRIKELVDKIDVSLPQDEYNKLYHQLNECKKAYEFNMMLLNELEGRECNGDIIDRIVKWQKDRMLHKQEYIWDNEAVNVVEELIEMFGYKVPKEKRSELRRAFKAFVVNFVTDNNLEEVNDPVIDGACDIVVFSVGMMLKMGYNPKCSLNECLKEIESRTGKIIDGKFVKDTSEEAKKRWYKANYKTCKGDENV